MKLLKPNQVFLILINILNLSFPCNALFNKKTIHVDRMLGKCPGYKNLTIFATNIVFNRMKTYYAQSMDVVVTKDTSSNIKFRLSVLSCSSQESLDTCEPYPEINFSNVCFIINTSMPPFNQGLENIIPKPHCPIKKGVYRLQNSTVDEKVFSLFPFEGYYFKIHSFLLDKIDGVYQPVFCLYVQGKIISV